MSRRVAIGSAVVFGILALLIPFMWRADDPTEVFDIQPWSGSIRDCSSAAAVLAELKSTTLRNSVGPDGTLIPLANYDVRFEELANPGGSTPLDAFRFRLFYKEDSNARFEVVAFLTADHRGSEWHEVVVTAASGTLIPLEPVYRVTINPLRPEGSVPLRLPKRILIGKNIEVSDQRVDERTKGAQHSGSVEEVSVDIAAKVATEANEGVFRKYQCAIFAREDSAPTQQPWQRSLPAYVDQSAQSQPIRVFDRDLIVLGPEGDTGVRVDYLGGQQVIRFNGFALFGGHGRDAVVVGYPRDGQIEVSAFRMLETTGAIFQFGDSGASEALPVQIEPDEATGAPYIVESPPLEKIQDPLERATVLGVLRVHRDPSEAVSAFDVDEVYRLLDKNELASEERDYLHAYAYASLRASLGPSAPTNGDAPARDAGEHLKMATTVLENLVERYAGGEVPSWLYLLSAYAYARRGMQVFRDDPASLMRSLSEIQERLQHVITLMLRRTTPTTADLSFKKNVDGTSPKGWFPWSKQGDFESDVLTDPDSGRPTVSLIAQKASVAFHRPVNALLADGWRRLRWSWRVQDPCGDDPADAAMNHPVQVLLIFDNLVVVHYVWDSNREFGDFSDPLTQEPWVGFFSSDVRETINELRMPNIVLDNAKSPVKKWIDHEVDFVADMERLLTKYGTGDLAGKKMPERLVLVAIQANSQYATGEGGDNRAVGWFAGLELLK